MLDEALGCRVGTVFLVPTMIVRACVKMVGTKKTVPTLRTACDRDAGCGMVLFTIFRYFAMMINEARLPFLVANA
jgi:hypothetical protein